jgi:hypothetical protein
MLGSVHRSCRKRKRMERFSAHIQARQGKDNGAVSQVVCTSTGDDGYTRFVVCRASINHCMGPTRSHNVPRHVLLHPSCILILLYTIPSPRFSPLLPASLRFTTILPYPDDSVCSCGYSIASSLQVCILSRYVNALLRCCEWSIHCSEPRIVSRTQPREHGELHTPCTCMELTTSKRIPTRFPPANSTTMHHPQRSSSSLEKQRRASLAQAWMKHACACDASIPPTALKLPQLKEKGNRGPRLTPEGLRPRHPRRGGRRGGNAAQHGTRAATREGAGKTASKWPQAFTRPHHHESP